MTSRYEVNDGAASTTSSPRSSVEWASRYSSSQVPQPMVICSGLRSYTAASASRRSVEKPSGYRCRRSSAPIDHFLDLRERRQRELVGGQLDDLLEAEAPLHDLDGQSGLVRGDAGELRDEADGHDVTPAESRRAGAPRWT